MTESDPRDGPPWGWWLRQEGGGFLDAEGRRWRGVRDAFWRGRLNMPDVHYADEQQELLLRVLASIDRRGASGSSPVVDLFGGDAAMWRFHLCWLASIGLIDMVEDRRTFLPTSPLRAGLSEEGRSVLLMLRLTRDPEWEELPMRGIVEAVARSEWSAVDGAREEALRIFERSLGVRRWTFARERLPNAFLVRLTGIDSHARMPTLGVMWSLGFGEARLRDDLFAWLATHVDRWDDWGERAYRKGAVEFTRHLLTVFVADTVGRS